MSSGCGTLLLFLFWMVAGLYGVGAFIFYVLDGALWVSIVTPIALAVCTYLVVDEI